MRTTTGKFGQLGAAAFVLSALMVFGQIPEEVLHYADLVLYNGVVLTVTPADTVAQAVAVRDGTILAVGNDDQIVRLAGPRTTKIDLAGKTVIPGIINTHIHPNRPRLNVYFRELSSEHQAILTASGGIRDWSDKARALNELKQFVQDEQRPWVTISGGDPTDPGLLKVGIEDLDQVAPDKPVIVSIGSWRGIINTKGLEALREKYTQIPGIVEEDGRPTGHIIGTPFWLIRSEMLPQVPHEALAPIYKKNLEMTLAPVGITTFSTRLAPNEIRAYRLLDQLGEMPLRLAFGHEVGRWNPQFERDMRRVMTDIMGYGTDMVWLNSISIGIPDVAPTRGGEVCSQYPKIRMMPGDNFPQGHCLWDEPGDPTRATIGLINGYGYRVANTHTYGDLGLQMAVETLEEADRERPIHRYTALDHSQLFNPTVIEKSGRLKMIWSVSASQLMGERSQAVETTYGREVADRMLAPVKSLLEAGALVSYEGESRGENPFYAFRTFVTRMTDRGYSLGQREAVDRKTALRIMTINGAKYVLKEDQLGSIEAGKLADLVILDRNPLDPGVSDQELSEIQVLMTLVGGKAVYQDASLGM